MAVGALCACFTTSQSRLPAPPCRGSLVVPNRQIHWLFAGLRRREAPAHRERLSGSLARPSRGHRTGGPSGRGTRGCRAGLRHQTEGPSAGAQAPGLRDPGTRRQSRACRAVYVRAQTGEQALAAQSTGPRMRLWHPPRHAPQRFAGQGQRSHDGRRGQKRGCPACSCSGFPAGVRFGPGASGGQRLLEKLCARRRCNARCHRARSGQGSALRSDPLRGRLRRP
jgi:hypothetical protein